MGRFVYVVIFFALILGWCARDKSEKEMVKETIGEEEMVWPLQDDATLELIINPFPPISDQPTEMQVLVSYGDWMETLFNGNAYYRTVTPSGETSSWTRMKNEGIFVKNSEVIDGEEIVYDYREYKAKHNFPKGKVELHLKLEGTPYQTPDELTGLTLDVS